MGEDSPDFENRVGIVSQRVQTLAVDVAAQTLSNLGVDIQSQSVGDVAVDLATQSLSELDIDISSQSAGDIAVDLATQSLQNLDVDISSQSVGSLDINVANQSVGDLAVDVASQSLGQLGVDIESQTVGDLDVNLSANSIGNLPIEVSAETLTGSLPISIEAQNITGGVPIDIDTQSISSLSTDIAAQSVGNLAVDLDSQSVSQLTVDIAAQSLSQVGIDITSQSLGNLDTQTVREPNEDIGRFAETRTGTVVDGDVENVSIAPPAGEVLDVHMIGTEIVQTGGSSTHTLDVGIGFSQIQFLEAEVPGSEPLDFKRGELVTSNTTSVSPPDDSRQFDVFKGLRVTNAEPLEFSYINRSGADNVLDRTYSVYGRALEV
jgi:imidazoleglycerol phosphate dehydratase HisB